MNNKYFPENLPWSECENIHISIKILSEFILIDFSSKNKQCKLAVEVDQ